MNFKDRIALVTGGTSGIGLAVSKQLADAGATVLIAARDRGKGEAALKQITTRGGRAAFFSVELKDAARIETLMREVDQTYGALHVLINCAGGGGLIDHDATPMEKFDLMIGDNFASAYLVTSYALPIMRRTGGAIVNISSTASWHGNYGLYSASKAGVEGLTRSMAVDFAPLGIRVNAISPGWIKTYETLPNPDDPAQAAWEKTASLLGRMGTTDEVANAVLFLASDDASFITGATLFVDGGLVIIDPTAESWSKAVKKGLE